MSLMPNENLRLRSDYPDNNQTSEIEFLRQQLKIMTERYNMRKELADYLNQQLADAERRYALLSHDRQTAAHHLVRIDELERQLATLQAVNQQLLEALKSALSVVEGEYGSNDPLAIECSAAIALSQDTSHNVGSSN